MARQVRVPKPREDATGLPVNAVSYIVRFCRIPVKKLAQAVASGSSVAHKWARHPRAQAQVLVTVTWSRAT